MPLSGAQITRLGQAGTPKMKYASFAGRTEATGFVYTQAYIIR